MGPGLNHAPGSGDEGCISLLGQVLLPLIEKVKESRLQPENGPTLVLDEHIYWRVPVILSLTSRGDVGEVGAIEVDVETGQLHVTPQLIMEINSRAEGLALSATSTPIWPAWK